MNTETAEITVTARHVQLTESIRDYAKRKLESINLEFPKVIQAHVILDVQKFLQRCEVVVRCTKHIRLQAVHASNDMYASIDLCVNKLARQMRKCKTRVQRHRPRSRRPALERHPHWGELISP